MQFGVLRRDSTARFSDSKASGSRSSSASAQAQVAMRAAKAGSSSIARRNELSASGHLRRSMSARPRLFAAWAKSGRSSSSTGEGRLGFLGFALLEQSQAQVVMRLGIGFAQAEGGLQAPTASSS